ncbi:MAG: biotin--[acetyl-CoA-carboxylase] ligase, partial [Thermodesulfovibrionales bacterium]|nr:biotin--[acetyl-CoA-carboxylase] ligase [Thermodesulfovibrionales bacterium]
RAAVWKKIVALREKDYEIEGSTAKGYRLLKTPEFSVEELRTLIRGEIGREIIFFESIGSTNTAALELAEKGAPHGTVVIADRQTKGKGRLGRTWVSPPKKNIYMSVILRPEIEPKDATLLTIMTAVSCAKGVMKSTGLKAEIKWPNDLMISNKKLGGILTEMKSDPDGIVFAVIGIGINVNSKTKKDFPPDIRGIATSIKEELGKIQSRTFIIAEILKELEHWYNVLLNEGRKPLFDEWKRLSATLGRKVRVTAGDNVFTGVAEDIDKGGMLILRLPSGMLKKISSGDLTMMR